MIAHSRVTGVSSIIWLCMTASCDKNPSKPRDNLEATSTASVQAGSSASRLRSVASADAHVATDSGRSESGASGSASGGGQSLPVGVTPEIRDFYLAFRRAVLKDDREYVARHVRYPIEVYLDGDMKKAKRIANESEFLKHYDRIMLDWVKRVISRYGVEGLASTKHGPLRLYRGQLFIYHACPPDRPDDEVCEEGPIRVLRIGTIKWLAE